MERYDYDKTLSDYMRESNCPDKHACIGFSKAVKTEQGTVVPCTAVYCCPFNQNRMYKWNRNVE